LIFITYVAIWRHPALVQYMQIRLSKCIIKDVARAIKKYAFPIPDKLQTPVTISLHHFGHVTSININRPVVPWLLCPKYLFKLSNQKPGSWQVHLFGSWYQIRVIASQRAQQRPQKLRNQTTGTRLRLEPHDIASTYRGSHS